jgi:hypothetical protein
MRKFHHYRLKRRYRKVSRYVDEIVPTRDLIVDKVMAAQFEDTSDKGDDDECVLC